MVATWWVAAAVISCSITIQSHLNDLSGPERDNGRRRRMIKAPSRRLRTATKQVATAIGASVAEPGADLVAPRPASAARLDPQGRRVERVPAGPVHLAVDGAAVGEVDGQLDTPAGHHERVGRHPVAPRGQWIRAPEERVLPVDRGGRRRPQQVDPEAADPVEPTADAGDGLRDDVVVLPAEDLLGHRARAYSIGGPPTDSSSAVP
jgi:hypothetical protein